MTDVYYKKDLGNGLYSIMEKHHPAADHGVMMYLVVGMQYAALVDSGFGVTDTLRNFVENITDKPIICIVAHGHPDHAGAAALFDKIYMNEKDEPLLNVSLSYERRMDDVFGQEPYDKELKAYCEKNIVMVQNLNYTKMNDGDIFDLGGKQLEVIAMPGHTQGSVALINRADNYALVSDCFSKRTAMVKAPTEKRIAITAYRDSLIRFLSIINENTKIYWGHEAEEVSHEVPANMLQACNEVLAGKIDNDGPSISPFSNRPGSGKANMREHIFGCVKLVYNADTL